MSDAYQRAVALRDAAKKLPNGKAKFALLQEAIELADSIPSAKLGYDLRRRLIDTASEAGRKEEMLVAFAWNLAQFDRDPGSFDRKKLLWQYKWVVNSARSVRGISRERIEALLDDLERRHREYGSTLRAVAKLRRDLYLHYDELRAARAAHRDYLKRKRDDLSDCEVCEAAREVDYWLKFERERRAFEIARQALAAGKVCNTQPHGMLARLLLPLLKARRVDEAWELHRRGYRMIESRERFEYLLDDHLHFLALAGDLAQAKTLIERHAGGIARSENLVNRFYFYEAMRLWTTRLLQRGTTSLKVRLPAELSQAEAGDSVELAALDERLLTESQELAIRLDERDDSEKYRKRLEKFPTLLEPAID